MAYVLCICVFINDFFLARGDRAWCYRLFVLISSEFGFLSGSSSIKRNGCAIEG